MRSREAFDSQGCGKSSRKQRSNGPCLCRSTNADVNSPFTQENVQGIAWVKNYKFDYNFQRWGQSSVTFTCVAGHILGSEFPDRYRQWHSCAPAELFEAPILTQITSVRIQSVAYLTTLLKTRQDKKPVASNIERQARYHDILFIWTDCDREGEHIGTEIRDIALKAKPGMEVWRARFSNIERAYVQ